MTKCLAPVLLAAALCAALPARAETVFVSGRVKAGLHEDKTLDSAITKLVASGTALEIIKREENLSFVRDPDGTSGWIDNSYLDADSPAPAGQLKEAIERGDVLERRLAEATQQIADLSAGRLVAAGTATESQRYETLKKQHADLDQQLKAERLNSGELQAQLAELKKRLEVQLSGEAIQGGGADTGAEATAGITLPWSNFATGLAIALIAGLLAGIYLMDYLNRRRHGGFRV